MNKLILPLLILFSFPMTDFTNEGIESKPQKKQPLCIMYSSRVPPDSIQEFIKVYFRFKKIDLVDIKDAMEQYKQAVKSEVTNAINSGNLANLTSAKATDLAMLKTPIANLLKIEIFNDSTVSNKFSIDSIHWLVDYLPVRENKTDYKLYIPGVGIKADLFQTLKAFSDTVLSSKLFK